MDLTDQVKYKMTMTFQKNREKSFQTWKIKSNMNCSSKKLAEAGFYFIGTKEEPDAVQCFFCDKQLDGWDENDDPWKEHISHSEECAFAKMRQPEENLTLEQLQSFHLQVLVKNFEYFVSETTATANKLFNAKVAKIKKTINALKTRKINGR